MPDYTDHGKEPYVIDIEKATLGNTNFRATLWTGAHLQMTVMSIPVGGDVGLEKHPANDQFLRVERGHAKVEMGAKKDQLDFVRYVSDDQVVMVPAGMWHNVTNTGDEPLKLYALYGPPDHVRGTRHKTQADALADPNEE